MKNRKFISISLIIIGITLALSLLFYVVLDHSESFYLRNTDKKPTYFGATYMTMNNAFFNVINDEIEKEIEAQGDILYTMDPALSSEKQVEQIYTLLDKGIQVLFINPIAQSEALHDALEECRNRNVIVICVDTQVSEDDYVSYTITSDNYNAGVLAAQDMMKEKAQADIVLLQHSQTTSGAQRIQGFVDTISGNDNYRIVERVECDGQLEIAMPKMQEVIANGVTFDVVMCLNDPSALGVLAALESENVSDVIVYGVDGSPETKVLIQDGKMQASVSQSPTNMGREVVTKAYQFLRNETIVNKEMKIPVTLINEENIGEYSLKGWQ